MHTSRGIAHASMPPQSEFEGSLILRTGALVIEVRPDAHRVDSIDALRGARRSACTLGACKLNWGPPTLELRARRAPNGLRTCKPSPCTSPTQLHAITWPACAPRGQKDLAPGPRRRSPTYCIHRFGHAAKSPFFSRETRDTWRLARVLLLVCCARAVRAVGTGLGAQRLCTRDVDVERILAAPSHVNCELTLERAPSRALFCALRAVLFACQRTSSCSRATGVMFNAWRAGARCLGLCAMHSNAMELLCAGQRGG